MTKANLEQMFEKELIDWKHHIVDTNYSSNSQAYINCDAYRNIVLMGEEVLPLIRKELETEVAFFEESKEEYKEVEKRMQGIDNDDLKDKFFRIDPIYLAWDAKYSLVLGENPHVHFVSAVKEIVGEKFKIPQFIRGKVDKVTIYTLGWLDRYVAEKEK
jgi:hypothetical protein